MPEPPGLHTQRYRILITRTDRRLLRWRWYLEKHRWADDWVLEHTGRTFTSVGALVDAARQVRDVYGRLMKIEAAIVLAYAHDSKRAPIPPEYV